MLKMNPAAPKSADAVPAHSLPASMARVLDAVNVSPREARSPTSIVSYAQNPPSRHNTANCIMLREYMQPTVAAMNRNIATRSGGRLPYLSLNGPKISCPKASPIMLKVRPSCTIDGVAEKYSAIAGKVGRYMSVTNGHNI